MFVRKDKNKQKEAGVGPFKKKEIKSWGAAIAQWIRLCLPSCCPGFESQAHHLRFYHLQYLCYICYVKRTKVKQKEAGFGPFLKKIKN